MDEKRIYIDKEIRDLFDKVGKKLDAGECIYPAKCIRCELYHNDCPEPGEGLLTELTAECKSFKEVKGYGQV